jgi:HAD superfamily hydrolase (TIGR01484 family)
MKRPFDLVSTDFDGTVFAEFEQPPVPLELQALLARLQSQGVTWIINTGRDMSGLMECMGRAHLTVKPDYLVLVEREIYCHEGSSYVPLQSWNQLCQHDHETLFTHVRRDLPGLVRWINERYDATLYEDPFSPLCLIAGSNSDADEIVAYLESYCRTVPHLAIMRNDIYARFSHDAYDKGSALAEIARRLDIAPAHIVAAGDHFNDLPMLRRQHAHHLIAPANAIPAVKDLVQQQGGFVATGTCGFGTLEGLQRILRDPASPVEGRAPASP